MIGDQLGDIDHHALVAHAERAERGLDITERASALGDVVHKWDWAWHSGLRCVERDRS